MPIVHQFEAQEIPDAPASATNFVEEPKSKSPFSQLKKLVKGKKKQVTFVDDDSLAQHIPDVELLERRPRAPTFADIRDQLVPPISPDQQVVAIEVEEEEIECEKPEEIVTRSAKGPFKAIRGFLSTSSRSSTEIVEDSPVIQVEPTPEGTIKPTTFAIIRNFLDGSSTEVNVEEKEEEVIAREQRSALINRLLTRAAAPNANQVTPRRASRKGLFIGINYYGTGSELRGCIADAYNMKSFLQAQYGFPGQFDTASLMVLTDEPANQNSVFFPSRANILAALRWLVADNQSGDSLFIHYSGHGGYRRSIGKQNESDGYDETIYPADFQKTGPIVDDDLCSILVDNLKDGVRLTALFDSCHSGTVLDLPFMYSPDGSLVPQRPHLPPSAPPPFSIPCFKTRTFGACFTGSREVDDREIVVEENEQQWRESGAHVFMFSGSKDDEVSTDACNINGCFGAMTNAFIEVLRAAPSQSYVSILRGVRQRLLDDRFDQTPCLSSNIELDMNQPFQV